MMDKPKTVGERLAEIKDEESIARDKKLDEVAGKEIKLSFPVGDWWTIISLAQIARTSNSKMDKRKRDIYFPSVAPLIRQFLQTKYGRRFVEFMEETVQAEDKTNKKGD